MDFFRQLRSVVTTVSIGATICAIAAMDYRRVNPMPIFVLGTIAILMWIPFTQRFSLRSLLITVTVLAVLLGIFVWLAS